ncbi:MAG: NYN domain-containing protein, partial [Chloroflexota bacterium]
GDDVALFIDWENFKISLAVGHRLPNVSALKEEAANYGRVVVAKAYADWVARAPELRGASQFANDPPALYAAGIEPVYVPTRLPWGDGRSPGSDRGVRVKNSVDVKMTADCIECSHSHPNIGTYILVTGDSDFIHVVNALRTMGKRVLIVGVSWSTSRRLADQVDGLILYDADIDPITPHEPAPVSEVRPDARDSGSGRRDLPEVIQAIEEIVRHERQAGGTPLLTSIKQRLMRRFPGFDEKKLGFSGFKKLMQRVTQEGKIKLTTTGMVDWAIMADEQDPREATAVPAADPATITTELASVELLAERREADARRLAELRKPAEEAVGPELGQIPMSPELTGETHDVVKSAGVAPGEVPAMIAELTLPQGPGDGQDAQRVADLIIMADTLEHREDISHVAFNFLVGEMCQALEEGLKAEHEEITQRWSQAYSHSYVTRMLRSLSNGKLFQHGWHSWQDQVTSRTKRRRTLFLNRAHPLVQEVLRTRWGPAADAELEPVVASTPQEQGPLQEGAPAVAELAPVVASTPPGEDPFQEEPPAAAEPSPSPRYSLPLLNWFLPRRE